MDEGIAISRRMVDICFAVNAAAKYDQWLGRVQLQKFIYLLDVLKPVYELMPPLDGHLTYKYGPYDGKIQNAADALVFRGFLVSHKVNSLGRGHIAITYGLNEAGESLAKRLYSDEHFVESWNLCQKIAFWLDSLGWARIVKLVYSEPTYVSIRREGWGQRIVAYDATKTSTAFILEIINHGITAGFKMATISKYMMVDLFFKYLDSVEENYRANSFVEETNDFNIS